MGSQVEDPNCGLETTDTNVVLGCCDECVAPLEDCDTRENVTCAQLQFGTTDVGTCATECVCSDGTVYDEVTKTCVTPENCGCVYNVSGDFRQWTPMDSNRTYSAEECPVFNEDYDRKYIHECVCICEDGKLDCRITTCQDDMGNYREPGETWDHPTETCKEQTCDGDGNIVTSDKPTPDFCEALYDQCTKEGKEVSRTAVDSETCCYACEERCERETKTDTITYTTPEGVDCVSNGEVDIEYCKGNCGDSMVMWNLDSISGVSTGTKMTVCRCCQGALIEKQVEFQCEDGSTTTRALPIGATDCSCSNCAGSDAGTPQVAAK